MIEELPAEDALYLDKNTTIFVLYDPSSMDSVAKRDVTVSCFKKYGYKNIRPEVVVYTSTIQYLDFSLTFEEGKVDAYQQQEWYNFLKIFKKARSLKTATLVVKAGVVLDSDIPTRISKYAVKIVGYYFEPGGVKRPYGPIGIYFCSDNEYWKKLFVDEAGKTSVFEPIAVTLAILDFKYSKLSRLNRSELAVQAAKYNTLAKVEAQIDKTLLLCRDHRDYGS